MQDRYVTKIVELQLCWMGKCQAFFYLLSFFFKTWRIEKKDRIVQHFLCKMFWWMPSNLSKHVPATNCLIGCKMVFHPIINWMQKSQHPIKMRVHQGISSDLPPPPFGAIFQKTRGGGILSVSQIPYRKKKVF